jgi:hypothetical protein
VLDAGGVVTCNVETCLSDNRAKHRCSRPSELYHPNTATISGDVIDPTPGNNTDSEDTTVNPGTFITYLPLVFK